MSEKETNPTFNDIRESYGLPRIENKDKEIEKLKIIEEKYKDSQLYIKDFKDEIERLNNIIKEVREYINGNEDYFYNYPLVSREHLLEILDKGE